MRTLHPWSPGARETGEVTSLACSLSDRRSLMNRREVRIQAVMLLCQITAESIHAKRQFDAGRMRKSSCRRPAGQHGRNHGCHQREHREAGGYRPCPAGWLGARPGYPIKARQCGLEHSKQRRDGKRYHLVRWNRHSGPRFMRFSDHDPESDPTLRRPRRSQTGR